MSFASVQGSSIGQRLEFPFAYTSSLANNTTVSILQTGKIPKGLYIYSINVSLLSALRRTADFRAFVSVGADVISQVSAPALLSNDTHLSLTGLIKSDGTEQIIVECGSFGGTTTAWGYNSGTLVLHRLHN